MKKNIKVEVKNRKNREIRSQRSLVVSHLRSLIGGRIRRASSVVSHVCDPNDIRHAFGMYHYARYIREWRPHDLIYVRDAVHRERHEEGRSSAAEPRMAGPSATQASAPTWCNFALHTCAPTPILRTAPTNVQLRRISDGRAPSLALDRMRSGALRLQFC